MAVVDVSLLTDAVVALLRSELPVKIGDAAAPGQTEGEHRLDLTEGWLTVQLMPAGAQAHVGSLFTQPEENELVRYQLTAGGAQRNQVERIANAAASLLVERTPGVGWTFPIPVAGHVVMGRRLFGRIPTTSLGSFQAGVIVEFLYGVA